MTQMGLEAVGLLTNGLLRNGLLTTDVGRIERDFMKKAKRKSERRGAVENASRADASQASRGKGWSGVLAWAVVSSVALLAAFPSINLYPLAWIAPIGWLIICHRTEPLGRRGYFQLWLSGCLFWLVSLHSVRLAFWVLYVGWVALALYLAVYIPLWIGVTRLMIHRWRVPLVIAAPVSWTGFELFRSQFLTGYSANTLGHSQAWQPVLIQIADTLGHGGISFIMMTFAALVTDLGTRLWQRRAQASASSVPQGDSSADPSMSIRTVAKGSIVVPALSAVALLAVVVIYGVWRLREADKLYAERSPLLRCLLLQENTPTIFEMNPNAAEYEERTRTAWTRYANLCRSAAKDAGKLDLVVWPESSFTAFEPYTKLDYNPEQLPSWLVEEIRQGDMSPAELEQQLAKQSQYFDLKVKIALLASRGLDFLGELPDQTGPQLLVGCDSMTFSKERLKRYAGALWIGSDGKVKDTYAKMHLVMFGEYIPLRPILGWLEDVFGFAGSDPGTEPKSFEVNGVQVSPNICFETMVPRLIRWQVKTLTEQDKKPELLVNLTNDSWFKGSSMLDHHLASSILCCVENRRPLLIAANTGLTAEIDGCGRLVQCSQRLTVQAVIAEPRRDSRWGLVQAAGYPLPWACAVLSLVVLAVELLGLGKKDSSNSAPSNQP